MSLHLLSVWFAFYVEILFIKMEMHLMFICLDGARRVPFRNISLIPVCTIFSI